MLHTILRGNSADPTLNPNPTCDEQLAIRVHRHVQRLQLILPVISVAVMALRQQNAELDEDIALVLTRNACDPLDVEIEQLELFLATIDAQRRGQGETPRASPAPTSDSLNG